ncbi:major facilitator superfamily MFS_1 [Methanohalobium evestigatum Z-7303]|uniref:Major facilitator superfamily MFS_1 n=1 Tax=Methanohalobium evestigatum (strain ATCC BAA-1072 / DSM 3721 / NBRC 107634 / OCM 161 / Z-7303) TaxID=644295 RepID=D7E908_METEZ|nr:MFS transporter [Methanohalobium evestigatum]ADI73956.1 major facilitator superfamily MFS_1 [Methanohalobium evestigatum Z-7303]
MDKYRILIYTTIFVMMGLSDAVVPILPELAAANHSNNPMISSLLFSTYFIAALITMIPFGILTDIYGNVRFIMLGILMTFVSGYLILITNNLWILLFARIIEGSACGAFFPAAFSMLSRYTKRNQYFGEFSFLLNAGLAVGVAISGVLTSTGLKNGILLFTAISGILFIVAIPVWNKSKTEINNPGLGINDKIENTWIKIYTQLKDTFYTLFNGNYINIWILTFFVFGAPTVFVALYPDYSEDFLSKTMLGITIASLYVSAMITSFLIGRSGFKYNTMIKAGLIIISAGAIIAINYPISGFIIMGIGGGSGMVGLPIAVSHLNVNRGLSMGLLNTCTYAGLGLMPLFAGVLTPYLSFEWIFLLDGIIIGISVFMRI